VKSIAYDSIHSQQEREMVEQMQGTEWRVFRVDKDQSKASMQRGSLQAGNGYMGKV